MLFFFMRPRRLTLAFKEHTIGALSTGAGASVVEFGHSTAAIHDVRDRREIKRRRPSRTRLSGDSRTRPKASRPLGDFSD
jgi:hypothetical protein